MKRFVCLLGLLFAWQAQTALFAQTLEDTDDVVFNAHLLETFDLTADGVDQEITFAIAADYNNGVIEGAGIEPGITLITDEATDIWNLTIECPNFQGYGGTTGTINIENLGVYCTQTAGGAHSLTGECSCAYLDPSTILQMSTAAQLLIDNGTGNAGDATDNAFTLHWEMGTPLLAAGGTIPPLGTMFDQLSNGDFTVGDYTTTAILTLYSLP